MNPDERVDDLLARLLEGEERGEGPSLEDLVAEHPDLEEPLRARLEVLRMLKWIAPHDVDPAASGFRETLSRTGRPVRAVSLPEPSGAEVAPVVLPRAPSGHWGRYAVQGEIARGGVGVVMRARDPDIGRDVALKILREEHALNPDVLQRFVEEAQVGGQLQHPGVVPVYDLGLGERRPAFLRHEAREGKDPGATALAAAEPRERATAVARGLPSRLPDDGLRE